MSIKVKNIIELSTNSFFQELEDNRVIYCNRTMYIVFAGIVEANIWFTNQTDSDYSFLILNSFESKDELDKWLLLTTVAAGRKRTLAKIDIIEHIEDLPGKDIIGYAHLGGWKCIVNKEKLKVGDKCVYMEIDSFLPMEDKYAFMKQYKTRIYDNDFNIIDDEDILEGYRVRSMKMAGVLSQGLALPLSLYPIIPSDIEVGSNVTHLLNIKKYDAPIKPMSQDTKGLLGDFPWFIRDTDQPRIQNLSEYFDLYKEIEFEMSLKLDGTSSGFAYISDESMEKFNYPDNEVILSRNSYWEKDSNNSYARINQKYDFTGMLKKLELEVTLQGEIMGPGIQKNREGLKEEEFFLYSIWDIKNQKPYLPDARDALLARIKDEFGIEIKLCPLLGKEKVFKRFKSVEELLEFAEGASMNNSVREGIVFKSTSYVRRNDIISFKVISNKFLLKSGH